MKMLIPTTFLFCMFSLLGNITACQQTASKPDRQSVETVQSDVIKKLEFESEFCGLYISNIKVGYEAREFELQDSDDGKVVLLKEDSQLRLTMLGEELFFHSSEDALVFSATAPYSFLRGTAKTVEDGVTTDIKAVAKGPGLQITQVKDGVTTEHFVEKFDYTLLDRVAIRMWDIGTRKVGDSVKSRYYDFSERKFHQVTNEITSIETKQFRDGVRTFIHTKDSSQELGSMGTSRFTRNGKFMSGTLNEVELRAESASQARNIKGSFDVLDNVALKVDRKLGDYHNLKSLEFQIDKTMADALVTCSRQQLIKTDGIYTLKLGPELKIQSVANGEAEDNLAVTSEFPHDAKIIADLAERAIGTATERREQIQNLLEFVDQFFVKEDVNPAPVLETIEARKGTCLEHSNLFTCLARNRGIPCRTVYGLVYSGDERPSFTWHAWNEVVFEDEWWPVDSIVGQFEIDAGYIQIEESKVFAVLSGKHPMRVIRINGVDVGSNVNEAK